MIEQTGAQHAIMIETAPARAGKGRFACYRHRNGRRAAWVLLVCLLPALGRTQTAIRHGRAAAPVKAVTQTEPTPANGLSREDIDLLDDISRRAFRYFWEWTDPNTGLTLDRARTDGQPEDNPNHVNVASIAATGFALSAFCIAAEHRLISRDTARERVLPTLRFFAYSAPREHGWFYHYMDSVSGQRRWTCEISSIDTALLLAGILTVRQYFIDDPEIVELSTLIYNRVDFPWMMDGSKTYFSHGWTPESGFFKYRWDTYSELMILYVLGIGSPTHPIPPYTWNAWRLPIVNVGNYTFVGGGPLFIQQYSQAWIDLRDRVDEGSLNGQVVPRVNYFANAVAATYAQQEAFSKVLSQKFPGYSANVWGLTASESIKGYRDWGGSLADPRIDGTVTPAAAGGSLMFAPDICIPALRTMLVKYGKQIYGRYGFADAFNPTTGWVSQYVIGIDVGITMLSDENLRTGEVWQWFMNNVEPQRALDLVGLAKIPKVQEPNSVAATGSSPEGGQQGADSGDAAISLSPGASIPASSFQFKIPVPAWLQTPSSPPPAPATPGSGPNTKTTTPPK